MGSRWQIREGRPEGRPLPNARNSSLNIPTYGKRALHPRTRTCALGGGRLPGPIPAIAVPAVAVPAITTVAVAPIPAVAIVPIPAIATSNAPVTGCGTNAVRLMKWWRRHGLGGGCNG